MSNIILKIENLTKSYGRHKAVNNVSLTLNKGESLALLGHNGAGKTTLFKLALNITKQTSGKITLFNKYNSIGYLPENIQFYPQMTGVETLSYYAKLKKSPNKQVAELLELVGLYSFKNRRVKTYSKGMRQRLGVAQALLGKPEILFLDEPTSGLDPVGREEFFQITRQLQDNGTSIIFSSHVLRELQNKSDMVAIMKSGKIIAYDTIDNLRKKTDLPEKLIIHADNNEIGKWLERLSELEIFEKKSNMISFLCPRNIKNNILRKLTNTELDLKNINITPASLADIYIKICEKNDKDYNV